jgi:hypothetical protein
MFFSFVQRTTQLLDTYHKKMKEEFCKATPDQLMSGERTQFYTCKEPGNEKSKVDADIFMNGVDKDGNDRKRKGQGKNEYIKKTMFRPNGSIVDTKGRLINPREIREKVSTQ